MQMFSATSTFENPLVPLGAIVPLEIPDPNTTVVEYIWTGSTPVDIRSKTRVFNKLITKLEDIDTWDFNGKQTTQAKDDADSEIFLKPVYMCKDPIRKGNSLLVLCEPYDPVTNAPARFHSRTSCLSIVKDAGIDEPWLSAEQDYLILEKEHNSMFESPLGWPKGGFINPVGKYACSTGSGVNFGRELAETHMMCCLTAGLNVVSIKAGATPAQWSFQLGPRPGVETADQLIIARYLLLRISEDFQHPRLNVSLKHNVSKAFDFEKSHCRMNITTARSRSPGSLFLGNRVQARETTETQIACNKDAAISSYVKSGSPLVFVKVSSERFLRGDSFEPVPAGADCDPYLLAAAVVDHVCLGHKHNGVLAKLHTNYFSSGNSA